MHRNRLAALALTLLAATAAQAGPYDKFVGMSLNSFTREVERQGFVYARPLDVAGDNESFLWRRGPTCLLIRTTNKVVVSTAERPTGECEMASNAGGSGQGSGRPGRGDAIDICKQAVTRRGYDRFDDIDADQQRGGWSVSGKAKGDRGRADFTCSIEGRAVRKLVINPTGGGNSAVVACESEDRRYKRCEMDTRRGVRLVERISETRCVEGQNWGVRPGAIWVDKGCAAKFQAIGGR